jgi:hypothetical protein
MTGFPKIDSVSSRKIIGNWPLLSAGRRKLPCDSGAAKKVPLKREVAPTKVRPEAVKKDSPPFLLGEQKEAETMRLRRYV